MSNTRPCSNCGERTLVADDDGNTFCTSCGTVQEYDNFQQHFGGISGPTGTFIRTGTAGSGTDFNYKQTKIYHAKKTIEHITSLLDFSPAKKEEVRVMVDTVTEGEYGQGEWFPVLVGACAYIAMRRDNKSLPLVEVGDRVGCDVHELGRMVSRVVQFMELKLPEFDIVGLFQRAVQTCFVSVDEGKIGRMLKQGIFLVQCMVKWYLTTGRRPLPVVVAVLVFVAQLNEVDVRIEDAAMELHVAVVTCKLRYKELLQSLVKVAQVLPWGKDITIKNIAKNAPCVLEYMELKSMSKHSKKTSVDIVDHVGINMDDLVGSCLSGKVEYGLDYHRAENDSQYFNVQDKRSSPRGARDDLDTLRISHECLSIMYLEYSNEVSNADHLEEDGCKSRKKGRACDLLNCREWWKGKSELSRKLLLKKILEKDVGLNAMPPSFVAGCLAYEQRRDKIKAAKLRIDKIMCPQNGDLGDSSNLYISDGRKRRRRTKVYVDWEDLIIETLLLHRVQEEEIEKGHYNALLDLHVFNSGSM